jgi:hypothetical protein
MRLTEGQRANFHGRFANRAAGRGRGRFCSLGDGDSRPVWYKKAGVVFTPQVLFSRRSGRLRHLWDSFEPKGA